MTDFISVAPVLPTRDVQAALARYEHLGFEVSIYSGGDFYGFVRRGEMSFHLSKVEDVNPKTTLVSAYLYASDADALHIEWNGTGVEGHFHEPTDTGLRTAGRGLHRPGRQSARYGSPMR